VLFLHALKNTAVPIVTTIGLGIGILLGGTVVTESVFGIPGLGRLAVDAIKKYPTGISSEWAEWWQQVGNEHGYILKEVTEGKGLGGEAAMQSQPAARRRR